MTDNDNTKEIMSKLSQLLTIATSNSDKLEHQGDTINKMEKKMDAFDRSLRGNGGGPGLQTRVTLLETAIAKCMNECKVDTVEDEVILLKDQVHTLLAFKADQEAKKDRAFWYMVTTLVATVITIALTLWKGG